MDILFILALGLAFGSFVGMLSYRLAFRISLINPKRSYCPNCSTQLKWYENIPVVSFVLLKASCSNCKTNISFVYPLIESIISVITILLYLKYSVSFEFIIATIFFYSITTILFVYYYKLTSQKKGIL